MSASQCTGAFIVAPQCAVCAFWLRNEPRRLRACQQPLCFCDMWPVIHYAVDADDTGIRRRGKCRNDRVRFGDRCTLRREYVIDGCYLSGVNRHLAGEAVAAGLLAFAA